MRTASPATPVSVRRARAAAPWGASASSHTGPTRVALGPDDLAAVGSPHSPRKRRLVRASSRRPSEMGHRIHRW
eukprot:5710564-Alexandrium_andersonii.AAC.1